MTTAVIREVSPHWGCYDRPPHKECQILYGIDSQTGKPIRVLIPNRLARDCQYTKTDLGQADPRCVGCNWRKNV